MKLKKTWGVMALIAVTLFMTSARPANEVMTKDGATYIVNTTTLAEDVVGYMENTPVKIFIKGDKIQKVEALPNKETPKYFYQVKKGMLSKWDGKTVKKALRDMKAETDAVTGATMSSNAISENVKRGLQYYLKNK